MALQSMLVVPVLQKEWQATSLVDEPDLGIGLAMIDNVAAPNLLEQDEVQFDFDNATCCAAIETQEFDAGRGGAKRSKRLWVNPAQTCCGAISTGVLSSNFIRAWPPLALRDGSDRSARFMPAS